MHIDPWEPSELGDDNLALAAFVDDEIPVIAVVEDDDALRETLASLLRGENYIVLAFETAQELITWLDEEPDRLGDLDLIITDIWMSGPSGLDLLRRVRREAWGTPVIVMSAFFTAELIDSAEYFKASALLKKPFSVRRILADIEKLHRR